MTPKGYSRTQIWLHWAVFLLIVPQFLFDDGISSAWRAFRRGEEIAFNPMVLAHIVAGVAILVLVLWRLTLRARRGAPVPPEDEHPLLKMLAGLTHIALYGLLILLPISGGLAWFGEVEIAGEVHEILKTLLMLLVGLHVVAALYHQFVLRTNLLARMKYPEA